MRKSFDDYIQRKKAEYGEKFDPSDLDARFVPAFESGERVRLKFYGEGVKTGTVSVSTGWKPVFILILTRRSMGSSYTLNKNVEFTHDKVGYALTK